MPMTRRGLLGQAGSLALVAATPALAQAPATAANRLAPAAVAAKPIQGENRLALRIVFAATRPIRYAITNTSA